MKLFWFERPGGNFGDDLNPWLWPRLLPGVLDDDPAEWFVGIGTLLNERLPGTGRLHVVGAGAGLGASPRVDARWSVHGVRGPVSAAALGLKPELIAADPAILAARFVERGPARARRGVGFMPHYASLDHWDWAATARDLGLEFVDPCAPVADTLERLALLESLVTEAMHGAIVADALRLPWVGVAIDPGFHAPKWRDWGSSVGVEPVIHTVPALSAAATRARDIIKRGLIGAGLGARVTPPPPPRSPPRSIDAARAALADLAHNAPRQLSADADLARAHDRLDAMLDRFERARAR